MPVPLSTAARNAIHAREIAATWFLELQCDEGTLRGWDQFEPITYDGQTHEAIGGSWEISGEIRAGAGLVSESLTLTFDSGSKTDDASFLGRLLDRTWHQRRIRIRSVAFNVASNFITPIGQIFEWVGYMDTISDPEGVDAKLILNCESGVFRARARNLRTVTDADQRLRDANDGSMKNIALKPFQDVPFGVSWATIPGAMSAPAAPAPNIMLFRAGSSK